VERDDALREHAERQHGLVATRQASVLGLSEADLRHRIARGEWQRETSRVLRLVGAPRTALTPAMRAALHHGPDAFISHQAALGLWGVPGFYDTPVHVMARRARNRQVTSLGIVHSTTDLRDSHLADVQGVPTVTPIRAIFDIAGNVHPNRVEIALDNAWSRRLLNYAVLHRTLEELARRGRPGIALLRKLAAERPADYRPPDSNNERRFADILEGAGERPLRRQIHVGDEADWIGRIDFVDDELPFTVEVQSEMFHGSVSARRRDKARIAALEEGGHVVLEIWETELWRDADELVRKVREKRGQAATLLHG
jgi:very-short-patch-repair endonuclease